MGFAEWDAMPLHEKLGAISDRFPPPLKCLIWVVMGLEKFDSDLIEKIADKMGYERAPAVEVELGGGMVLSPGITYVLRPEMVIES